MNLPLPTLPALAQFAWPNWAGRTSRPRRCGGARRQGGFSLLELLVVIGVIVLLSAVTVVTFGRNRAPSGQGAANLASSMVLSARMEAMSLGYGALLIIDNSSDPLRRYQRMGIFRFTTPRNINDGTPELTGSMVQLPRRTFFLPDYSTDLIPKNNLTFPPVQGSPTPALAMEFDGNGHLVQPPVVNLVFSPNVMNPDGSLLNPEEMIAARHGFRLSRNGRPIFFQMMDDMPLRP